MPKKACKDVVWDERRKMPMSRGKNKRMRDGLGSLVISSRPARMLLSLSSSELRLSSASVSSFLSYSILFIHVRPCRIVLDAAVNILVSLSLILGVLNRRAPMSARGRAGEYPCDP